MVGTLNLPKANDECSVQYCRNKATWFPVKQKYFPREKGFCDIHLECTGWEQIPIERKKRKRAKKLKKRR